MERRSRARSSTGCGPPSTGSGRPISTRSSNVTAREWDDFIEPIPDLYFPKPAYAVHLRRSALAAALHADAEYGAIASGFDRGLSCVLLAARRDLGRRRAGAAGTPAIGRGVYQWLNKVRQRHRAVPLLVSEILDRRRARVGDAGRRPDGADSLGPRAALPADGRPRPRRVGLADDRAGRRVCCGDSGGHPGLRMLEDLNLISSAGSRDQLFGAFLYSNACVVAGLRAAARLAARLGVNGSAERWNACADRIWNEGILRVIATSRRRVRD